MAFRNFLVGAITVLCFQSITAKDCEFTPKPDFKAPGRRISEEKCFEYNWERNNVEKCSKEPAYTDYPYVGMIGHRSEEKKELAFVCGTFLISPKFAVAAGYCVDSQTFKRTPEIVRFGNSNIKADGPRVDVKIKKIIIHPSYKPPKKADDIALLELEEEVPMTKSVQPICLWHSSLDGLGNFFSPGWGVGLPGSSKGGIRDTLRVMKVELIDHERCEPLVQSHFNQDWPKLEEHQICANESVSDDPLCQGSGGIPLVTVAKLAGTGDQVPYAVGVTSFGFGCGRLGFYTKIPSFIDWIEETVWPKA